MRARPIALPVLLLLASIATSAAAQPQATRQADAGPLPSIEEKTAGLKKLDGYFPLYWDERTGQLWMEVSRLDTEVLHSTGFGAGLGSNDIGIDRGALSGSRIVVFERVGPKVLMVAPNLQFRAVGASAAETRAVKDAFARSVLWGFQAAAESPGRVLVDATEFLVRDATNVSQRLRPGSYRFDPSRSSLYLPMTQNFPKNTEMEAELTFVIQPGVAGPAGGGGMGGPPSVGAGGAFLEGVRSVAASAEAATIRVHHSLAELPDGSYKPRAWDPRSGFMDRSFKDYSAPLGTSQDVRYLARHRLQKADPKAAVSDPVKPIVYYLDPGAPEPIRSALLEGARWWNQAFEAAGYRDAFRVELLPEGVSPLDIRYNVINWVHRSTRGWSTGGAVIDPRTGEIIKGVVTLGSLRIRQDYMLAEGILSPYRTGTEAPPELKEWALARIRQLSAHEVGHTIGLGHNYYDSAAGRISVMDYPHPLVTLKADGTFDSSKVYATGMGEWDKVSIAYGLPGLPGRHRRTEGAGGNPERRMEEGPDLPHGPGHRGEPPRRSVVERHRRRGRTHAHDGDPAVGARALRRERDQARRAAGDDGGGAAAAVLPSPLPGRGGRVRARRPALRLRRARRRARALHVGDGGRAGRRAQGPDGHGHADGARAAGQRRDADAAPA